MSPQLPFFVYGTLLPGQPNYHLWAEAIRSEQPAFFPNGRLYDMTLLNLGHYPMLVEEQGEQAASSKWQVMGVVVETEPELYRTVLATLDILEDYRPDRSAGSFYRRVKRIVTLTSGRQVVAWAYLGRAAIVAGLVPIPEGNWKAYCANRKAEVDRWWAAGGRVSPSPDSQISCRPL
jgi:gamma-glutamylcyclotransferase (GGCT)/AIG2-like uncharacterized protein YtfP